MSSWYYNISLFHKSSFSTDRKSPVPELLAQSICDDLNKIAEENFRVDKDYLDNTVLVGAEIRNFDDEQMFSELSQKYPDIVFIGAYVGEIGDEYDTGKFIACNGKVKQKSIEIIWPVLTLEDLENVQH